MIEVLPPEDSDKKKIDKKLLCNQPDNFKNLCFFLFIIQQKISFFGSSTYFKPDVSSF